MKKIILVSAFVFTASSAFSQLTIKPNGNNPSYLYVKDQVVFVEKDINLEINPGDEYIASIYLRDEAQLIQGESNSENEGDGYLSVQQKTNPTNAFAYYYWASPVGNSEGLSNNPGNINFGVGSIYEPIENSLTKAKKVSTTTDRNGYVNRSESEDLTISTRWLYTMTVPSTEKEDGYQRINANNAVPAGFGFTMKGVNDESINAPLPPNAVSGAGESHEQLYEFRGRPNNGIMEIPVEGPEYSGSGSANLESKMTLAGNPYPSAIDLNWVFNDNPALNAFYFYDEDRTAMSHLYSEKPYGFGVWIPSGVRNDAFPGESGYNAGVFVNAAFRIWDKFGNSGGTSDTGKNLEKARIASIGQGIMFVGSSSGNVEIKNSHRRYVKEGAYSGFFRPTEDQGFSTSEGNEGFEGDEGESGENGNSFTRNNRMAKLRLYVTFDDALTRDLLLTFSPDATDGFDRGFDAISPGGMDSDAFFPIEREGRLEPYVINGTNFERSKRIPITFKLHKQSQIKVFVPEEINKRWEQAYLYDAARNRYTKLVHPEQNNMAGRIILSEGVYADRFFIVFEINPIAPKPEDVSKFRGDVGVFQNNPGQQLEIRNPQGYEIRSMNLFDITGKLVRSEKNLGNTVYHQFATSRLSDGIYIVKLTTTTDVQVDYKVIIMNK